MEKELVYNPTSRWSDRATPEKEDGLDLDETLFYNLLRQPTDRVDYVCFTLKSGKQHLLSASDIIEMYHQPDTGIVLFFSGGIIRIEGRNLNVLFRHLQDRRVKEVREFTDKREMMFNGNALFVERIVFESENVRRAGM